MRDYEMMFIMKPDLSEEVTTDIKARLHKIIEDFGGEFTEEAGGWGQKAHGVQDRRLCRGYLLFVAFQGNCRYSSGTGPCHKDI
jgi:small subunit ribosomal protein S6